MGRLNSLAGVLADWDELLDAVRRSPDLQADVEGEVELLAGLLAAARELKARQNELAALRQEATQKRNAELVQGKGDGDPDPVGGAGQDRPAERAPGPTRDRAAAKRTAAGEEPAAGRTTER